MAERSAAILAADTFGIGILDEDEANNLVALRRELRLGAGDFIESEPADDLLETSAAEAE
jgi:hypothetical protein